MPDIIADGCPGLPDAARSPWVVSRAVSHRLWAGRGGETARGGFLGLLDNLAVQDEHLVGPAQHQDPAVSLLVVDCLTCDFVHSAGRAAPIWGIKLWALKETTDQGRFSRTHDRVHHHPGHADLGWSAGPGTDGRRPGSAEGATSNHALPMLFIELFPTWLAGARRCRPCWPPLCPTAGRAGRILLPNYRQRSLPSDRGSKVEAPANRGPQLDRQVLYISRVATVVVLVLCAAIAWGVGGKPTSC